MTQEERCRIALLVVSVKVFKTFEGPNSKKSKEIATSFGAKTGIPHLELHRFHNAIINKNVVNSFKPERTDEISWKILKAMLLLGKTLPDGKLRGELSGFANEQNVSFNNVLETFRMAFKEIVEESLVPQKKP